MRNSRDVLGALARQKLEWRGEREVDDGLVAKGIPPLEPGPSVVASVYERQRHSRHALRWVSIRVAYLYDLHFCIGSAGHTRANVI